MRQQHEKSVAISWKDFWSVALFEMNAAFHEGIASASGNRFFLEGDAATKPPAPLCELQLSH
jgi:DNA-binding GntR family transcriptional regulator